MCHSVTPVRLYIVSPCLSHHNVLHAVSDGVEYLGTAGPYVCVPLFTVLEQLHASLTTPEVAAIAGADAALNVMHLEWSLSTWPKANIIRSDRVGDVSEMWKQPP